MIFCNVLKPALFTWAGCLLFLFLLCTAAFYGALLPSTVETDILCNCMKVMDTAVIITFICRYEQIWLVMHHHIRQFNMQEHKLFCLCKCYNNPYNLYGSIPQVLELVLKQVLFFFFLTLLSCCWYRFQIPVFQSLIASHYTSRTSLGVEKFSTLAEII